MGNVCDCIESQPPVRHEPLEETLSTTEEEEEDSQDEELLDAGDEDRAVSEPLVHDGSGSGNHMEMVVSTQEEPAIIPVLEQVAAAPLLMDPLANTEGANEVWIKIRTSQRQWIPTLHFSLQDVRVAGDSKNQVGSSIRVFKNYFFNISPPSPFKL